MKFPIIPLLTCMLMFGCKKSDEVVSAPAPVVNVTVTNLPTLPAGQGHYQVWATFIIFSKVGGSESPLHDSGFVSLGEFNVGTNGQDLVDPDGGPARFAIPAGDDPQLINEVIIALQAPETPLNKVAHEERGAPIIGARFLGTSSMAVANLNVGYIKAFGTNFSGVAGKYTITAS